MANLLNAKDLQELLRVDRSTIYRMAEDGKLPAIKVGRQWRFPETRIQAWLRDTSADVGPHAEDVAGSSSPLGTLLSAESRQAICDLYAEAFGTMAVITDMAGLPLTKVSNPCGFFELVSSVPENVEYCLAEWRTFSADPDFEARFVPSQTFGFLCARGLIRLEHQLVGMFFIGGVAPEDWPPGATRLERMAEELQVPVDALADRVADVHHLDDVGKRRALALLPKVGALISRLASERWNAP